VVGLVLFAVANRVQESAFERDFERAQLVRATEIQSRTERAAERNELESAQREFGELAVFEEIRAAIFISPDNHVRLSSRRDWIDRPLDLAAIGLADVERPRVEEAMQRARTSGQTESLFSLDRDSLTFIMPATVPVDPGELSASRGALILLIEDLSLSKLINRQRLLRQFGVGAIAVFLAVVGLGISLQALVTRRIERLHDTMRRFAAGAPLENDDARGVVTSSGKHDEIVQLQSHFNDIAATVRHEIAVRRQAEDALRSANERYARQEAALTTLTATDVSGPDDFITIVRGTTEVVAKTLSVAIAGVWRHDEGGTVTRCQDLFEWPSSTHTDGISFGAEASPAFFRALAGAEVLAVADARTDMRTAELARILLAPQSTASIMCVPIRSRGATVGFLSCTHVGRARRWMPDEQTFALAVTNLLSTLIAQAERQRLEQQLRQGQKLEAIGRLAGGIAHDFNNILTVILGRIEEVTGDPNVPEYLRESVTDLSQNAQRAASLTRQLLTFSRQQAIEVRDVDLNAVVANVARLLHRVLGEDIEVSFKYSEQPLAVRADPGMIEQVLLNLAVNARDAMPDGGRLSIDTSLVEVWEPAAALPPGKWTCVRVRDTGVGIAPEHLAHIFEPFFTTKDIGKGTGLGLATTYGIVQQHGGWIDVDSEVGKGTVFRVFFPWVAAQQPAMVHPQQPVSAPRGCETILVVEDEPSVRALVIKLLQDLGYRLLQAPSGPSALEVWREHGKAIDLLITDIVMPEGMNGVDLAERLRRSRPELKVIYTSGYLADLSHEDVSRHQSDAFIAKPFRLTELAKLVRRTLDGGEVALSTLSRV
jgi:signal transduction histidine kinase/HAMP domain-containing protein